MNTPNSQNPSFGEAGSLISCGICRHEDSGGTSSFLFWHLMSGKMIFVHIQVICFQEILGLVE